MAAKASLPRTHCFLITFPSEEARAAYLPHPAHKEFVALLRPYLEWCRDRGLDSGVLAEQFHPHSAEPISVSPLTWSHATVITVVMRYLLKHAELTGTRSGLIAELASASS